MSNKAQLPVLVVGGGIAGQTLALFLHRLAIPVRLFEAYPARAEVHGAGLMIAPNGMSVLMALGLDETLTQRGAVVHRMNLRNQFGNLLGEVQIKGKERFGVDAVICSR